MLLVLVALVGGSTALGSRDDEELSKGGVDFGSDLVSTTTTTIRLEPLTIPLPPPARSRPPSQLVAVTPAGAIVVVDVATGRVIRRLAFHENSPAEASEVGIPSFVESLVVSTDGWVWYSVCCEPAAGALFRVPLDGSAAFEWVGHAWGARVAPGDRYLAGFSFPGVVVADLAPDPTAWDPERGFLPPDGGVELAWSLDGRTFVVRTKPGPEEVGPLFVIDAGQLGSHYHDTEPAESVRLPGDAWRLPAFRRDGKLVVADRSIDGRWAGRVIDVHTHELRMDETFAYGGRPLSQAFDATGEWLLTVVEAGDAGRLAWRGPDGSSGTIPGRYLLATW